MVTLRVSCIRLVLFTFIAFNLLMVNARADSCVLPDSCVPSYSCKMSHTHIYRDVSVFGGACEVDVKIQMCTEKGQACINSIGSIKDHFVLRNGYKNTHDEVEGHENGFPGGYSCGPEKYFVHPYLLEKVVDGEEWLRVALRCVGTTDSHIHNAWFNVWLDNLDCPGNEDLSSNGLVRHYYNPDGGGDCNTCNHKCKSGEPSVGGPVVTVEWCGDGECDNGETCSSCPTDCGACGDSECTPNNNYPVTLFEHRNYGGLCKRFSGYVSNLKNYAGPTNEGWNDATSSVKTAANWKVKLWRHSNKEGDSTTVKTSEDNMHDREYGPWWNKHSWNDEVSSLEVYNMCGNGNCDSDVGETKSSCQGDCSCNDGICDSWESFSSCPEDCGCKVSLDTWDLDNSDRVYVWFGNNGEQYKHDFRSDDGPSFTLSKYTSSGSYSSPYFMIKTSDSDHSGNMDDFSLYEIDSSGVCDWSEFDWDSISELGSGNQPELEDDFPIHILEGNNLEIHKKLDKRIFNFGSAGGMTCKDITDGSDCHVTGFEIKPPTSECGFRYTVNWDDRKADNTNSDHDMDIKVEVCEKWDGSVDLSKIGSDTTHEVVVCMAKAEECVSTEIIQPQYPSKQIINQYLPYLQFDERENYYPVDFYFDDYDTSNNPPNYQKNHPLTVYVNVHYDSLDNGIERKPLVAIEYWFYYAANPNINYHDHDWEGMFVLFRSGDFDNPLGVGYYHHMGGHFVEWANVPKTGTHPKGKVACGAHATYPDSLPIIEGACGTPIFEGGKTVCSSDISSNYDWTINYMEEHNWWGSRIWKKENPRVLTDFGSVGPVWEKGSKYYSPAQWANDHSDLDIMKDLVYGHLLDPFNDLDLHVYDELERHVGENYETGEIDVEIPNATFSRTSKIGGEEFITVPMGMKVRFEVSTHDAEHEFEEYTLIISYADNSGERKTQTFEETIERGTSQSFEVDIPSGGGSQPLIQKVVSVAETGWEVESVTLEAQTLVKTVTMDNPFDESITQDLEINVPAGFSCAECGQISLESLPGENTWTFTANGDVLIECDKWSWSQDVSKVSDLDVQYLKGSCEIENTGEFDFDNIEWQTGILSGSVRIPAGQTVNVEASSQVSLVEYAKSEWSQTSASLSKQEIEKNLTVENPSEFDLAVSHKINVPEGFECNNCELEIDLLAGEELIHKFSATGDVITECDNWIWVQDPEKVSDTDSQYIRATCEITNTGELDFNKIRWSTSAPDNWSGDVLEGELNMGAGQTNTLKSTADGDFVDLTEGEWVQDNSKQSGLNEQFIQKQISITSNSSIHLEVEYSVEEFGECARCSGTTEEIALETENITAQSKIDVLEEQREMIKGKGWNSEEVTISNNSSIALANIRIIEIIDASIVKNEYLKIWNNTKWIKVKINTTDDCNSSNPNYTVFEKYQICSQDVSGDGIVEYWRWIQPGLESYQIGGKVADLQFENENLDIKLYTSRGLIRFKLENKGTIDLDLEIKVNGKAKNVVTVPSSGISVLAGQSKTVELILTGSPGKYNGNIQIKGEDLDGSITIPLKIQIDYVTATGGSIKSNRGRDTASSEFEVEDNEDESESSNSTSQTDESSESESSKPQPTTNPPQKTSTQTQSGSGSSSGTGLASVVTETVEISEQDSNSEVEIDISFEEPIIAKSKITFERNLVQLIEVIFNFFYSFINSSFN